MTNGSASRDLTDEDLAHRAQRGCRESFDELMKRYQAPILHFLRGRTAPAEAEDLLQESFLRAFRKLDRYRSDWSVRTWLFTIARRVCIDSGRRARATVQFAEEVCDTAPDSATVAADNEERRTLWAEARRLLSEIEQTALWLHYVQDMPIREVAGVISRSPTATKVLMFRARRTLAEHLPAQCTPLAPREERKCSPLAPREVRCSRSEQPTLKATAAVT
jgi:RNA polymerase sigma-70 factor, ECF subfamily